MVERSGKVLFGLIACQDRGGQSDVKVVPCLLGRGEKGQRLLGAAALFFKGKRHRGQFGIGIGQFRTQGLGGGGVQQGLRLLFGDLLTLRCGVVLQPRDQRFHRLAPGGGQTGGLGGSVDFIAGGGKGEVQRLLFGQQVRPFRLKSSHLFAQVAAFGQKPGHLRLEPGDAGRGLGQRHGLRIAFLRQRGDQRRL